MEKVSPFKIIDCISGSKEDLIRNGTISEDDYTPFIINRHLSYFTDTLLAANQMNCYAALPHQMQFDYYINTVSRKKRYTKWHKPSNDSRLLMLQKYLGCSLERAKEFVYVLTEDQLNELVDELKQEQEYGGVSNESSCRGEPS